MGSHKGENAKWHWRGMKMECFCRLQREMKRAEWKGLSIMSETANSPFFVWSRTPSLMKGHAVSPRVISRLRQRLSCVWVMGK